MSGGQIPLAGVIGAPVAHSKSPALHGYWLKRYGLTGYYIPMEIEPRNLKAALKALPKLGFVGVNITLPHKEAVLELADIVTDRAALIGAANTLIFRADRKVHADNTDGYGFIENLRQAAPDWSASQGPAAVLGAGGAARAVVAALIETGAPEIRIANRTKLRAEQLRAEFGRRVVVHDWPRADRMLAGAALVVNTTSLGMTGKTEMMVSLAELSPDSLVTDLVYAPLNTRFLEAAAEKGCRTVDGLGMLLHQAVPAFERWFGHRPAVDEETRSAVLNA